jgi:hypothetical protein
MKKIALFIGMFMLTMVSYGQNNYSFYQNTQHPTSLEEARERYGDLLGSLENNSGRWNVSSKQVKKYLIDEWNRRHPSGPYMDTLNVIDILSGKTGDVFLEKRIWAEGEMSIAHITQSKEMGWSRNRANYSDGEWVVESKKTGPFLSIHCGNLLSGNSQQERPTVSIDGIDNGTSTATTSRNAPINIYINVEGATAHSNSGGNTTTSSANRTTGSSNSNQDDDLKKVIWDQYRPQPGLVQQPTYQQAFTHHQSPMTHQPSQSRESEELLKMIVLQNEKIINQNRNGNVLHSLNTLANSATLGFTWFNTTQAGKYNRAGGYNYR